MRNLTLGGIATAALLLAAAPSPAQAGFPAGMAATRFAAGTRDGAVHEVTYRYRYTYPYRRYRSYHSYYGYGGGGGGSVEPTVPSWYGHVSYGHF